MTHTARFRLLLLSTTIAGLPLAAASQAAFDLDTITFSANRTATELARTGTSVSVVTREEIEKSGAQTLSDILARLPGVGVTGSGPTGTLSDVRLRGVEQRFVTVLIDGVAVNDPSSANGAFDFGGVLAGDVARVEVLRGAQSALYGSGAVAGVINITTARPTEDGTRQSVEVLGGSFGTVKGNYGLSHRSGPLEFSVSLAHSQAEGFSAAAGQPEPDGHRITRLSFSTRYQIDSAWAVGASAFTQSASADFDNFLADAPHYQLRDEVGGRLFAEYAAGSSSQTFELTGYGVRREQRDGTGNVFEGRRIGLAWRGETVVSDALTMQYGIEGQEEYGRSVNLPAGTTSRRVGAYGQLLWAPLPTTDVAVSLRVDNDATFGTFPTGRVALAHRPSENLTLRASVGTGYLAPSLEQRFGASGGSFPFQGNPGLTPERSLSAEIGADVRFAGGATLGATLFRIETDNLISGQFCPFDPINFSCVAGTFNTVANVPGRSLSQGLELTAVVPINDRFALSGSYTYTDSTLASGQRRLRVPAHDLSVALDAQVNDRLTARLALQHVADRRDFLPSFVQGPMPDYTVVNLSARYRLSNSTDLVVRVDNVFDADYQTVAGYGTSRRAGYVGIAARF